MLPSQRRGGERIPAPLLLGAAVLALLRLGLMVLLVVLVLLLLLLQGTRWRF